MVLGVPVALSPSAMFLLSTSLSPSELDDIVSCLGRFSTWSVDARRQDAYRSSEQKGLAI